MATTAGLSPRGVAPIGAALGKLQWYLNRLCCMTPVELPHRFARALRARAECWLHWGATAATPPTLARDGGAWVRVDGGIEASRHVAAANRIAAGTLDVFALRDVDVGTPPRWNRDPKTGTVAPLSFGKLLDYRDPRLVGDIKYLWEPNRHMHLVTLAQAYALGGDSRYATAVRRQLETWFAACPYRMGPNWSNALEPAIRLINWSATWHLLGGGRAALFAEPDGRAFRARWLESVYDHARFIRGHLSRHSSANNHLIGEAAGLYIAMRTWPFWPRAEHWRDEAAAILEREALLQNAPDGVNREQAVAYHQFELDLLLLSVLAAKADGANFSAALYRRLEAMLDYVASLMDVAGNVPQFGDSDDGFVVKLSQEADFCPFRSLLATGAVLFERADFRRLAGKVDDKTRWLLGARATAAPRANDDACPSAPRRAFTDGGYYILGCGFGTAAEIKLVADAGPLGYETLAAHGHADALSFTLSIGGHEMLIDPGTYTYRPDSVWRAYFRGTAAHNTVRIDGRDQSEPGGNFMWLRHARTECSRWLSTRLRDEIEASHDGYARLPDPVVHRRRITVDKRTRRIVVDDALEMCGTHDVELYFHCSEHCRVEARPDGYVISHGKQTVVLKPPRHQEARCQVHIGATAPICGWISRRFDVKEPAPTIVWRARLQGSVALRSVLIC